jgi:hypothetical protein
MPAMDGPDLEKPECRSLVNSSEALREVARAHNRLHRSQAMLIHLRAVNRPMPSVGPYLEEAKHTYRRAGNQFHARDFEAAWQLAAASCSLSFVVEILISKPFREVAEAQSSVTQISEAPKVACTSMRLEDLCRVENLLARIHWVVTNGTLPSEECERVERVSRWTEDFLRCARRFFESGAFPEAADSLRAANAAVLSAEHLCRMCYAARGSNVTVASL